MTSLDDLLRIESGAQFLNADLHVHTHGASADVKDATMTPEAVVESAVRQGLSAVAITDHNSDKNIEPALVYASRYAGELLLVPGVEVTTAHGHLLVYFPPDRPQDLSKLLSRLNLVGEMGEPNTHTPKSMADTIAAAYDLGAICIAAHIDRAKTGFDAFTPGYQNWKRDILLSPGLYGLECDSSDSLAWYSAQDDTGATGAERRKLLTAREASPLLQARHHLAHLQGSDAHSMAQFENAKPDKPWTRIKLAELSFHALRIALVDPTARVRARASVPKSFPRIRAMDLTGGFLHNERVHFSDNMTCFIGGRGTGKSTAIRALAYAFGQLEDFGSYDNCPDSVTVYCEDENGVFYRYRRQRGGEVAVKAKEDDSIGDMPPDSFRIEYFGQGELAEVAKDPLHTPALFEEFLDRHTRLADLAEAERALVGHLRENAARLAPLETAFALLGEKRKRLQETNKKLKVAEDGNLRGIVSLQSSISAERTVRQGIEDISNFYNKGLSITQFQRSLNAILASAGECTKDAESQKLLASVKRLLDDCSGQLKAKETEINALLKTTAQALAKHAAGLKVVHQRLSAEAAQKIADLKARGLITGSTAELDQLLRNKAQLATEITRVEQRRSGLEECRNERQHLLEELASTRASKTARRKQQLKHVNANLGAIIKDYTVFVKYEEEGITAPMADFLKATMHGTYLQDDVIEQFCESITPADLAGFVGSGDSAGLQVATRITKPWAQKMVERLSAWDTLYELQVLEKPPRPVITVKSKSLPAKDIPVVQLSDGQRHTILLTIAMLAETNVPLVIDQPEDDLDNAFIFSSIVTTLRDVKERRQVILVTHNANIAVLGDSELLLPMTRDGDVGRVVERGAIDRERTKQRVEDILEGGSTAFLRRKEIYGH